MYYHHLNNLIVLFLILPSLVQLTNINSDVLIIPNRARSGFVLLEETKPSRLNEFSQCINDNHRQLNINIDEKYGDLILNQTVENQISNQQQQLLCTIHRNETSIFKLFYTIIDSLSDVSFTSPIYHIDPRTFVVHRFSTIKCLSSSNVEYEFVDTSIPLSIDRLTGEISSNNSCSNLEEILVQCTQIDSPKKHAYAKIKFDQICQENSHKQSNIEWINRIGEERRKRNHFHESPVIISSFQVQSIRHRRQQSAQAPTRLTLRFNESYIGLITQIKYCRKQTSNDHLKQTFQFPVKYEQFLAERLQMNEQGQLYILRPFDYEYFQTVSFQIHCLILEQQNGGMNLTRVNKTEDIQMIIEDINDQAPYWIMDEPYQYGNYFGYVEKSARPETPVFRFKAFDPDTTSKLTYEIVQGDKNLFSLSSDGTLTTQSNQQLHLPMYNLTVRAIDLNSQVSTMSKSNEAHLIIRTERFEPKFFQEKYIFNVSEYTQPSTIVGKIRAKSFSTTSDHLRYFLQQPMTNGLRSNSISSASSDMYEFKIDETEGSIKILKMLRYSDQHNNNTKVFTGVVKELGGWQMASQVEIEIHVIDVNDKTPTFQQTYYTPQIAEDYPLNTPIINFTVTDDDARYTPNSNIILDLIDPYGKFAIYNDTRVSTSNHVQAYLIAKERLDYESLPPLDRQYKLRIIARDHGQPKALQSEAQIYITITDVNDEPPVFKENPVQKTIAENTQRGAFVVFVDVVDTEYNDSVTVQFLPTSEYNPFRIITSPGGGRVILENPLLSDKESYNLTIQASDRLGHISQAQLIISIFDVNDHTPHIEQCENGIITASIRENATANTAIIKINATDADRGLNGEIQFSLKGTNDPQQDSDMFSIDIDTGFVYNRKKLKHLKSGFSEYTMTIFAQDKDPSNPRSTHCILKITVEDINDHYPVITSPARDNDLISIKMEKRVNFNYPVLVVRAKDEDSGKNALLHFMLKSRDDCSNGIEYFVIDSQSGVISTRSSNVNNPINLQIKYCLVVQVCDSPDDGVPKCSERKIQFQLSQDGFEPPIWAPETALTFQRVMKVVELAQQNIVIDTFKASIANDQAKKVIFEMEPFNWTCSNVALASEKPRIPFLLTPDENGRNIARLVIYQPIDADPPTGCTRYQFKIRAKNAAMEALSLESIYEIEIVDSNDNIPMFNVSSYRAQIYENEVKDNLLRVQAEDKDIDPKNRNTTYFIRCPNDGNQQNLQYHYNGPSSNSLSCQGIVSIDPETGWISVQRQFDYDNPADRRFVFDVFAKNILPSDRCSGQNTKESQSQSSLASGADTNPTIQICVTEHRVPVIIEVLDRNDNAPQFNNLPYFTKVLEDAEPGTTIFHLNVSDVDTDDILTFSIVNEQEASAFAVKENTGEVYLASSLDYERVQQHSVEVQVSDSNNEHRARTILTVIVEDANDNPPRFLNLPKEIMVEEGRQTFDYDQLIIRQPSRMKRDMKKSKEHHRKRTSTTTNSPDEFDEIYSSPSSSQPFTSRIIYKVEAIDPDLGRPLKLPIRYTLTSSNPLYSQFFEIHPLNGTIHLKQELDRDPPHGFDEWLLTIIAADEDGREDMGSKKNASWLKIIVKDINDLPPMFIDVHPIGHIPEDARAGTRVDGLRIKATDYDKLSENTTRYALTLNTKSIDGSDVFRIDEYTADIYLNVDNYLDREKTPHHNLSVIARDSGDQSGNLQSKELKITIIIDDVNDMPPRFKPTNQQAQISEIAQRGDFVTEVRAEDDDIGVNTHSLYEIIEECQLANEQILRCSRPRYFIFKETALAEKGTIILLEPVNYDPPDNQMKFLLKIKATNGGMSDYANVTVFITDANDNVPVFSQSVYFVNISEETALNQEIVRVHATDNDVTPINKEFIYRIPPDRLQYENRQHLRIDAIDGRIYLKKNFDREKSSTISLPIEAVNNQSSNMLIGRAVLVLNVMDVNDNYPRFAEDYSPRIREHSASRKILDFKINDPDEQVNGKTRYQMKLGKNNVWPEIGEAKFRLDIQNDYDGKLRGTISSLRELDREELCAKDEQQKNQRYCGKYYDLPIWMSDGEQSGINHLRILVEDINDNPFNGGLKTIEIYDYNRMITKLLPNTRVYLGTVFTDDEDDWDLNTKIFELQSTNEQQFIEIDKSMKTSRSPGAIYLTTKDTLNSTIQYDTTYKYDVSVRDSHPQWLNRDTQTSQIEIRLHDLPMDAVDNAASVRFQDLTAEEFIETRFRDESFLSIFKRLILEIVPKGKRIDVFSIQNHPTLSRTIDVYYALHSSDYLSKIKINGLVEISRSKLEQYFQIVQIGIDECLNADQQCFTIGCLNKIEILSKQPYLINANQTSFLGLHLQTVAQCACDTDINIQQDKQKDLLKSHKYCLNGGYPTRDNQQIKCICPDQTLYNGGERCQLTSISFDGNGYGWYKPLTTCDKWMLTIEILTQTSNGSILYNGPLNKRNESADYFSLQLLNGRLLIDLNFGSGENIRRYLKTGSNLADGKWHTIEIRQMSTIEHTLEVLVDFCPMTIHSKQSNECRFMIEYHEDDVFSTNQPLQLGGIANQERENNEQKLPMEYMGNFRGCLRNLRFAEELYDLHVDLHSGQSVNLHEGCLLTDLKCQKLSCQSNSGVCDADVYQAQCVCKSGRTGPTCGQETTPYDFTYDKHSWTGDRASYATFRHQNKPDNDYTLLSQILKFQIMFRTRETTDKILTLIDFHNDDTFMFLEIKSGRLQARFGSKSDTQLIELRHVPVNDGRWHTAYLDRYGQRLMLKIDDGESYRSNISYGKSIWKHFPNTLLNVGARIDSAVHKIVTADFNDGCIMDVRFNGQLLDLLNGSSSSDMKWTFQSNIKEGCDNLDNWCRGVQCRSPAFCVNTWRHGQCQCTDTFKYNPANESCIAYDWCEDITNPCHMPGTKTCLFDAREDTIKCECKSRWQGERCTVKAMPLAGTLNWHIISAAMLALLMILSLILLLVLFTRRRQSKKAYILGMDDEIRDNIINYDEEGCPDEDPVTYDISTLKKPVFGANANGRKNSESEAKPLLKNSNINQTDSKKSSIRKDMPPVPAPKPILNKGQTNGINVGEFIKGRIRDIDDDPSQPPYDSLQEYAYEGEPLARTDECTLSTLTIASKDQNEVDKELELEYLKSMGPKFQNLAKLYTGNTGKDS